LQIVSKRYITGKDEVKDIGHDQPMVPNYDENIETTSEEEVADAAGESVDDNHDVQADPQEILWTKPYQGSVHEGVQPETDRTVYDMVAPGRRGRRFFDMLSGADLGDDFMRDPTVEDGENVVRDDSGLGADTYDEPLVATGPTQDAVPWIPIRKSWFSEFPLDMKVIKRIAKEEKLDPKHFEPAKDIRQRLLQKVEMHAFSNGQKVPGFLVLIEADQLPAEAEPRWHGPVNRSPDPEEHLSRGTIRRRDGHTSPGERCAPQRLPRSGVLSAPDAPGPSILFLSHSAEFQYGTPPAAYVEEMPTVLSAKELEYSLGKIRLANVIFKDKAKKRVNTITIMSRLPLDTSLGDLAPWVPAPFVPPAFTPFKNVQYFINNPPKAPTFGNVAQYFPDANDRVAKPPPTPPAFDLSIDFKTFELSKDVSG
jgi:hypothetical protein